MFGHDDFLNPLCFPSTIDSFAVRRAILNALRAQSASFHGTVLDIGCGKMPYKSLILSPPSRAQKYIGLDLAGSEHYLKTPDLTWDGRKIPLPDNEVEVALATEVLEHCPKPELLLSEAFRVLKPGGLFFFTVPFLWPLHDVPHDEYRYTPFALERFLREAGFERNRLEPLGGWDASLAQMIGLWARRRPMARPLRGVVSLLAAPLVGLLHARDRKPAEFHESSMITGLSGTGVKPNP